MWIGQKSFTESLIFRAWSSLTSLRYQTRDIRLKVPPGGLEDMCSGHNMRWRLSMTSLHRVTEDLLWCWYEADSWPNSHAPSSGEVQLQQLLFENQEHFLWNPSILYLLLLMKFGGVHWFLLLCIRGFSLSTRMWVWCGFAECLILSLSEGPIIFNTAQESSLRANPH